MDLKLQAVLTVATTASAVVFSAGTASADSDRHFSNSYDMIYRVFGATHFHVIGNGHVPVQVYQTSGASTTYDIRIEREVCGVFGCNWDGRYVGGTCTRTISNTTPKSCDFNTGSSGNRHRVVLTKANDGSRVRGTVTVS